MNEAAPIGAISFFKGLSTVDLMTIMKYCKTEDFEQGHTVFHMGDAPNGLYVVLKGRVRIYIPGRAGEKSRSIATLEPGTCFGEFGLVDGEPRSASVDTIEMAQLLFLPAPAFEICVRTNPTIAKNVVQTLCEMVKSQRNLVYASERDRQRIETGQVPATLQAMQVLSALLRYHNKRVQILGLK